MSAALKTAAATERVLHFLPGEAIFSAGDPADSAYIIEHGSVEVWTGDASEPLVLAILEAGELFGELGVLGGFSRSACATAISETRLVVVSAAQLSQRVAAADPIVRLIVGVLVERFRTVSSQQIASARSEVGAHAIAKMRMEAALHEALVSDRFQLFYQPIVDLQTGRPVGAEALLRWNHPLLGPVNPQEIISLAEETDLILAIDHWVVSRAVRDLSEMPEDCFVTINLSGQEVGRTEILDMLDERVAQAGVSPGRVKLEVTEGVLIQETLATDWIACCQRRGYPVVLDDFGTGYSSLSYLMRLSVGTLKIDRSFIVAMEESGRARSIVRAVLGMAQTLEMTVVAEGVETPEMAAHLAGLGCALGQGYGLARPMAFRELLAWLSA